MVVVVVVYFVAVVYGVLILGTARIQCAGRSFRLVLGLRRTNNLHDRVKSAFVRYARIKPYVVCVIEMY